MDKKLKVLIVGVLAILVLLYCVLQSYSGGDFKIYLGAAELLRDGENCYNVWIPLGGDNYCGYSYSPFFATLLIPFTYLPDAFVQFLWLVVNLIILYRLFIIISWYLPIEALNSKQYYLWILLSSLLVVRFVMHNFEMVQMTIFILYCCLEASYQMKENRYALSGFLIALGIIVKIIPIILIPYFIYRKQFKLLLLVLVFVALFLFGPALIYGWEFNNNLLSDWFNIINPSNPEFVLEQNKNGEGVHSLTGFLAAYFTQLNETELDFPRTIINLKEDAFQLVLNSCRLFFIIMTLYFLKFPPFAKAKSKLQEFWELSYIFCIIPLIFPHQQKYAFFFLAPACFLIVFYLIYAHKKGVFKKWTYRILLFLVVLHFILSTVTTDGIIGGYLCHISQFYKTITFGTFILIVALMMCSPKKLKLDHNPNNLKVEE